MRKRKDSRVEPSGNLRETLGRKKIRMVHRLSRRKSAEERICGCLPPEKVPVPSWETPRNQMTARKKSEGKLGSSKQEPDLFEDLFIIF